MSRIEQTIEAKKAKRLALEKLGVVIHPYSFAKKQSIVQAIAAVDTNEAVQTAGRVMAYRAHGKVVFLDLLDQTGKIQVMLHQGRLSEKQFEILSLVDPGDFLGVSGLVEKTRTGEITIIADNLEFLGKSLRPLPSEFNTASDKEARFRQRYLDLLINVEARQVLQKRWQILRQLRAFLQEQLDYTEVETPILQTLYGGTNARPFTTHMNSLDADFYLRIAPELYLKRLLVGGMERIFEIARNFRNEGIDQTHLPEFTMVEWYRAYGDYQTMMDEIENLIKFLQRQINESDQLKIGEQEIALIEKDEHGQEKKWPKLTMSQALQKYEQLDVETLTDEQLQKLLTENKLKPIGAFSRGKAIFSLFDHLVTKKLLAPTWIIDYPKDVSPLAKTHRLNPDLVERYELYIGGKEIADGWSEITDPLEQRARFENEQQRMREGDDEAQPLDEEFLTAMEYGLPPLGGVGLGIDRLAMLLTNTWSIKEVVAFPTLKGLEN
ncbi:MAG: lysine--tRNA ligase [bacterium]|nr:lysine--tRNA ligase [bacterium]